MRIAITSRGPSTSSDADRCFGRAYWYLIFDLETKEWFAIDNNDIRNAIGNAGQMAAELLKDHGVDTLLTGETGPKAFRCLTSCNIAVYHCANGTVTDTLESWARGNLQPEKIANGPGNPFCLTERVEPQKFYPAEPKLSLAGIHPV